MSPVRRLTCALALWALLPACASEPAAGSAPPLETDEQKTLYALGLALAQNLGQFSLSPEELKLVQEGLADGVLGRDPQVDLATYGPKLQQLAQDRATAAAEAESAASADFLEAKVGEEGAVRTESGLVYTEITAGTGDSPAATDQVTVHYEGTLRDGTVFDSSRQRGEPATFALNQVIACWTEGLQRMKVGGTSRLVCPAEIAYGVRGRPGIPGGAALVFEVELLGIGE